MPIKTTFVLTLTIIIVSLPTHGQKRENTINLQELCSEIGNRLSSITIEECYQKKLISSQSLSRSGRPLAYKTYPPVDGKEPLGRVLLMGGIHGDEYSAVTILFKWMQTLDQHHSGLFHWQLIPLLNPDGLLDNKKAKRQNSAGVDLNRNFPSSDWEELALKYWETRTYKNPRRYPGPYAMSEPETKWFASVIHSFKPDVIIAVHAPHKLVDYDGPHNAPKKLGALQLRQLGTYPGSLGNYAGVDLGIPVVTLELASAGIMPSKKEISSMWRDLVRWLSTEIPKRKESQ